MFGPLQDVLALVVEHIEKMSFSVRDRDLHVLQTAHLSVDAGRLEGAQKAEARDFLHPQLRDLLAFEADRAGVDRVISDDRIEQGRLARAVRADQPGDTTARHGQGNVAVGDDAAKRFCDIRELDDRVVHSAPFACGANSIACDRTSRSLDAMRTPKRSGYFSISQPTMPCWK